MPPGFYVTSVIGKRFRKGQRAAEIENIRSWLQADINKSELQLAITSGRPEFD